MNINKKRILTLTLILISSSLSFATEAEALAAREGLVSALYFFATIFAMFMGVGLMVLGGVKLKKRAENPNDTRSFPSAIIITFIAGALAFNYSGSMDTLISSLLGDTNGYCFILHDDLANTNDIHQNGCWVSTDSDMLGDLSTRIDEMSAGQGDILKQNAEIIVGLFQFIGFIYFLKGLYGLKLTSEGNGREGYGKPIVTLIGSAFVFDLPHTLEMLKETVQSLGFGV